MAASEYPRIFQLGDSAITVEFGDSISEILNDRAVSLAERFDRAPFPGFIESVPAYASTTFFYDPVAVRRAFPNFNAAGDAVKVLIESAIAGLDSRETKTAKPIEIPVDFSAECGLDLEELAVRSSLKVTDVISIFTERLYRVYMLGFLPGFAYMGEVDERIASPRKENPRTLVPKGSIGIAGRQTGIYSLDSPGGWQIIGRTDVSMFRPEDEEPCFLKAGDHVQFVPVS